MVKSKYTSVICMAIVVIMLLVTLLFCFAGATGGITAMAYEMPYASEAGLFSTDKVHSINIVVDESDWENMTSNASKKEYINCTAVIDGTAIKNIAIRTKGNSSLQTVESSSSDRYSFKIEFDHYVDGKNYQGLDKLALNNVVQDNTYLKDYLCYQLMNEFGADAPLCSFAYMTVNGEDWGLYLAVEGIEESFAQRNYGNSYGQIYKPESMSMVGGGDRDEHARENMPSLENMPEGLPNMDGAFGENIDEEAKEFFKEKFGEGFPDLQTEEDSSFSKPDEASETPLQGESAEENSNNGDGSDTNVRGNRGDFAGGGIGGMGGSKGNDVALIYSDDEYSSYSNIFDNAKFDILDADKDRLISSLKQLNEGENIEDIVNIEEVLRYFVVHNFVLNFDSYTGSLMHNYYLYEDDGMLSMIAWDYNLAFGGFGAGGMGGASSATSLVNFPIDTPVSGTTLEQRPLLNQLLSNDAYLEEYHRLFAEFISEFFDTGKCVEIIDSAVALIDKYVENDPTAFCSYEEFKLGSETLREMVLLRAESVEKQLNGEIATTSDGQSENSSNLVDASEISLEAMGSNSRSYGVNKDNTTRRESQANLETPDDIDDLAFADFGHHQSESSAEESEKESNELTLEAAQLGFTNTTEDGQVPKREDMPSDGLPGDSFPNGEPPSGERPNFADGEMSDFGAFGGDFDGAMPDMIPPDAEATEPNDSEQGEAEENAEVKGDENIAGENRGERPSGMDTSGTTSNSIETVVLTLSSVAILALGLLFAKFYKI